MRDVARLAGGVHPSTVSLALRNHPGISEATRKRVKAAARKLGYRPDPLLDAFNTHRLEVLPHKALPVIAFVADFESRGTMEKSPHHRALWAGARAAAETLHCQIELFLLGKGQLTPERLNSILRARGIVSLVLGACRPLTPRVAFEWENYSAVKIESTHLAVPLYTVSSDQRQAARVAYRKLHTAGYRRIGLATTPGAEPRQDELYRAGFLLEQTRWAESAIPTLDLADELDDRVLREWIQTNRIDAIISDRNDIPERLAKLGYTFPEPMGFAGLDVPSDSVNIAGIVADHTRVGAQAVEQVVSLMRTNQRGLPTTASCTFVPVAWRDGPTARS
jgi:LacI family transcriptional regulator